MKNENKNTPLERNAWWLDYVEGEFDPVTKTEMKAMLRHSKKDQEIVAALSETKKLLQRSQPELPTFSDELLDRLHDQIMTKVGEPKRKTKSTWFPTRMLRNLVGNQVLFKSFFGPFGLL